MNVKLEYPSEYKTWIDMKQRCYNLKNKSYSNYGGRGIKVHYLWIISFYNFLKDVGMKPSSELTLERINNDGNYEPGNCKWATRKEQSANQRLNSNYTLDKIKAEQIRELYKNGYSQPRLARMFKTSQGNISRIVNLKQYIVSK